MALDPARVVAQLRELQALTGDDERRPARRLDGRRGTPARAWLAELARGPPARASSATRPGNDWWTLRGDVRARRPDRRPHRLGPERRLARRVPQRRRGRRGAAPDRRGGHAARHGAARQLGRRGGRPLRPLALRLLRGGRLDARPGRAAGAAPTGTASRCPTRSARTGSTSTARSRRTRSSRRARAYLELHIEQGPVLESMDLPLGAVLGTFGVERWRITWTGQAAHAGSTPMDQRRDALAGAAKLALEIREIAARDRRAAPSAPRAASSAGRGS